MTHWCLFRSFMALLAGATVVGCRDEPLVVQSDDAEAAVQSVSGAALVEPDGALPAFPELVDFVQPVSVDLPAGRRPYEMSDQALIDAVAADGGKVFIGFKPPGAERTRVTGITPGIRKVDALSWRAEIEATGAVIIQTYRMSATVVAMIEPESAPDLNQLPFVNFVEPVGTSRSMALPVRAAPLARDLAVSTAASALRHEYPAQDTAWGISQVRAPAAWAHNLGSFANITILDQGVDSAHALTQDGGDAVNNLTGCLHSSPTFTSCWPEQNDNDGHGAWVLGIAAGRDNSYGWVGIAPIPASVTSVRVCSPQLGCPTNAIIAGLDWVASNGIGREIVNMSFGGFTDEDVPTEYITAIGNAYNSGALLIASGGNTSSFSVVPYPALDARVMAVSGTREGDVFASPAPCTPTFGQARTEGSLASSANEISAPFTWTSMWSHLRYGFDCGTSGTAPVVTGVAALIWTKWPGWSASQVRSRLTSTAKDLGTPGRDQQFGWGRVDAQDALFEFAAQIFGPNPIETAGTYEWSASTNPTNGGDGSYSYQWAESYNGGSTWFTVGTNQTFSRFVDESDGNWHLRVTITSAGYAPSETKLILNHIGGCSPCR